MSPLRPTIRAICIAGALALGCQPLGAQDTQPAGQAQTDAAPSAPIVVEGMREAERDRAVDAYAHDLTQVHAFSPVALYDPEQFCPGVVGLSPRANAEIADRMRKVAAAAGIDPGEASVCRTSALVVFVDDTTSAMATFRRLHPNYFLELTEEEIVFHGLDTPVAGWKLLARIDRNGNPIQVNENGVQIVEATVGMSRLESPSRVAIAMSVLMVERAAVRGLTTRQIADYAVMRSVTDKDPANAAKGRAPTILSVMNSAMGDDTPNSLTEWDLAYVQARYAVKPFSPGQRQAADIRGKMKRALTAGMFGE